MDATTHPKASQPANPAASQIEFCNELIAQGMQMARAAAAQAMREAEEQTAAIPPARRRTRDPNLAFIRISREIRQLVTLAARLAAAPEAAKPAPKPRTPELSGKERRAIELPARIIHAKSSEPAEDDERRAPLLAAAGLITENHPYREEARASCTSLIEAELAADSRRKRCPADMLITIADTLSLDIDSIDFPPALMEQLIPPAFQPAAKTRQAA